MATYCMIWKKFHQKYLLVIINYPPERILRQYISMSNFLIFGVFKCLLHKNSKMSLRPVFSDRGSYINSRAQHPVALSHAQLLFSLVTCPFILPSQYAPQFGKKNHKNLTKTKKVTDILV